MLIKKFNLYFHYLNILFILIVNYSEILLNNVQILEFIYLVYI